MIITAVWVPGHPKTKGSMEHIGRGQMRETVDNKRWRELVTVAVREDIARRSAEPPTSGPVSVDMTFWLDHQDVYGPSSGAGDLDKLLRLIGDALKDAGAYRDDNQTARFGDPLKLPSNGVPGAAGALIVVRTVSPELLAHYQKAAENMRRWVQQGRA